MIEVKHLSHVYNQGSDTTADVMTALNNLADYGATGGTTSILFEDAFSDVITTDGHC